MLLPSHSHAMMMAQHAAAAAAASYQGHAAAAHQQAVAAQSWGHLDAAAAHALHSHGMMNASI